MSVLPILAQPINAEVGNDGRLLRADLPILRLHLQAGGIEGSFLAIPQLAALALLAHRLKMRLSRAVRVASEDEDIEMWVDAHAEGDVAKLAILSWRNIEPQVGFTGETNAREAQIDALDVTMTLLFDADQRLVRVSGIAPEGFDRHLFGQTAEPVLRALLADGEYDSHIAAAMDTGFAFDTASAHLRNSGIEIALAGRPQLDGNGAVAGYQLAIKPHASAELASPPETDDMSREMLFGRQLAPVLRQPLGRIIANAETMGNALQGPIRENYSAYAKDIANAARHLVALVDDLGDLEAVERADFSVAQDNIELGDVARRVAGLLALKAADHSIRIQTPAEGETVPAVAEFRRVLQIMLNLVTNAIRYSSDGTEVRITIASDGDFAAISVSDQGQGVPVEDRERMFEKFERLGRTGDGGSGLGLYISRRLARAMGGDLTVDDAEGGGAKFTLRLPARIS